MKTSCAFRQGRRHAKQNIACQDYAASRSNGLITAVAVADGCSGATYAAEAARINVETGLDFVLNVSHWRLSTKEELLKELLACIQTKFAETGLEMGELSATLSIAAVKQDGEYLLISIGDSRIAAFMTHLEPIWLVDPCNFGSSSETLFTNQTEECLAYAVVRSYQMQAYDFKGFAVCTDGCERMFHRLFRLGGDFLRQAAAHTLLDTDSSFLDQLMKQSTEKHTEDDASMALLLTEEAELLTEAEQILKESSAGQLCHSEKLLADYPVRYQPLLKALLENPLTPEELIQQGYLADGRVMETMVPLLRKNRSSGKMADSVFLLKSCKPPCRGISLNRSVKRMNDFKLQSLLSETSCTRLYTANLRSNPVLLLQSKREIEFGRTQSLMDTYYSRYTDMLNHNTRLKSATEAIKPGEGYTNILKIVDFSGMENVPDHKPYILYESIRDGTLLSEYDSSDVYQNIERIFLDIAKGVQFAHREGVVHGALHSQNIFLRKAGKVLRPKLFGFGTSAFFHGTQPSVTDDCKALILLLYAMLKHIPADENSMKKLLYASKLDDTGIPDCVRILMEDVLYSKQYTNVSQIITAFQQMLPLPSPVTSPIHTRVIIKPPSPGISIISDPIGKGRGTKPDFKSNYKSGSFSEYERNLFQKAITGEFPAAAKDPVYTQRRFCAEEGDTDHLSSPYPTGEVFKRLCRLQALENEAELHDGDLIGKGAYGSVIYRKGGTKEFVQKIFALHEIVERCMCKDILWYLCSFLNEWECYQKTCDQIAKYDADYSTPYSYVKKIKVQAECFLRMTETGISRTQRPDIFRECESIVQKAAFRSADCEELMNWLLKLQRMLPEQSMNETARKQMMQEQIHFHDYLCLGTEFGLSYYYFMHWFQQTPEKFFRKHALTAVNDLFSLLSQLHSVAMIHTDIKPSNLLLVQRDNIIRPVLIDFNTSHISRQVHLTGTATMFPIAAGSYLYMPDYWIAIGSRHENIRLTQKVDVYAMGMVACQLLDDITTADNVMRSNRKEWEENHSQPRRLPELSDRIFPRLWSILCKCLSRSQEECPLANAAAADIASLCYGNRPLNPSWESILIEQLKSARTIDYQCEGRFALERTKDCHYPSPENYRRLCDNQFHLEGDGTLLADKNYAFPDKKRVLIYRNTNQREHLQMLFLLDEDGRNEQLKHFIEMLKMTRILQYQGFTRIADLNFEDSTPCTQLQTDYEKEMHQVSYVKLDLQYGLLFENYLSWLNQTNAGVEIRIKIMYDIAEMLKIFYQSDVFNCMLNSCLNEICFSEQNLMIVRKDGKFKPVLFGMEQIDLESAVDVMHNLGDLFRRILNGNGNDLTRIVINSCTNYGTGRISPRPPAEFLNKIMEKLHSFIVKRFGR